jgi:putative membrane protein
MKAYCMLALSVMLLAGCHRDRDDQAVVDETATTDATTAAETAPPPTAPTPSAMDATMPAATDAVPMVMAIDQHEIDAAQIAKDRATRPDVKEFAAMLDRDHRANLAQAQALQGVAAGSGSPAVAAQRDKGQQELTTLQGASDFDAAYLEAMVDGHADALDKLDSTFIPGASDDAVRNFLVTTRAAVSTHLDKARALQGASSNP